MIESITNTLTYRNIQDKIQTLLQSLIFDLDLNTKERI